MRWDPDAGGDAALLNRSAHHGALAAEAERLLDFFEEPDGVERFAWRRNDGEADTTRPLSLYAVARLVHCFSVAQLTGRAQAGQRAEEGIGLLMGRFAEPDAVGFAEQVGLRGEKASDRRTAYGHAFALLAGASGVQAGIPGADALLRPSPTGSTDSTCNWRRPASSTVRCRK